MKKIGTLLLLLSIVFNAFSQITFVMSDVPAVGFTQRIAIDTFPLPVINFGNKGANQVYDFSNLVLYKYDTVEFRTLSNNQRSICPNADLATTADGINFLLTNTDTPGSKLILEGVELQICPGQPIISAYSSNQKPDIYRFPTTYPSNFSGTGYLQKTVSAAQVCQSFPVTQVRLTTTTNYTDTIDGWGKVITPVGAYKCLRKQRKETTTTLIEAQILGSWSTVSNKTQTTFRYSYLTKEAKGSVINFNYDTANVLQSVSWAMNLPNAPIADFSFAQGTNGIVNFTDLSDNYPTSWAWTFGDGGTSTQQNPSHTYMQNGTYTVCLIATNVGGSSIQVCKQVIVNSIAVTPVADFTWANPSGGLVNFTDQSANTPIAWAWVFGDGGTSSLQNPNHVYTANNTYNVCLTATNSAGSNQKCKNVIVTGVSAGNHAPVAANDTLTVMQGNFVVIHVAANDADPDNDNICLQSIWGTLSAHEQIGGSCDMIYYLPDTCFTGVETFYYSICDNGSPVMCDTATITAIVSPNSAYTAVAYFDLTQVNYNCTGFTLPNSSQNYLLPMWMVHQFSSAQVDTFYNSNLIYANATPPNFDGQICVAAIGKCNNDLFCDTLQETCTGIVPDNNAVAILYPNPTNDELNIQLSSNREITQIEIYNGLGKKVKTVSVNNNGIIKLSVVELAVGNYTAIGTYKGGDKILIGKFVAGY